MTGQNETEEKITCKLTNNVLKSYFDTKASDMRKLTKEDKAKANKIANECGSRALTELRNLSTCHLRLNYSRDDFFEGSKERRLDGSDAILELYEREELFSK